MTGWLSKSLIKGLGQNMKKLIIFGGMELDGEIDLTRSLII